MSKSGSTPDSQNYIPEKRLAYDYDIIFIAHLVNEKFRKDTIDCFKLVKDLKEKEEIANACANWKNKYPLWDGALSDEGSLDMMLNMSSKSKKQWTFFVDDAPHALAGYSRQSPVNIIRNDKPFVKLQKQGLPWRADNVLVLFHDRISSEPPSIDCGEYQEDAIDYEKIGPGRFLRLEIDMYRQSDETINLVKKIMRSFKYRLGMKPSSLKRRNRIDSDLKHLKNYWITQSANREGISPVTKSAPEIFRKRSHTNITAWKTRQQELNRSRKRVKEIFKDLGLPVDEAQ